MISSIALFNTPRSSKVIQTAAISLLYYHNLYHFLIIIIIIIATIIRTTSLQTTAMPTTQSVCEKTTTTSLSSAVFLFMIINMQNTSENKQMRPRYPNGQGSLPSLNRAQIENSTLKVSKPATFICSKPRSFYFLGFFSKIL